MSVQRHTEPHHISSAYSNKSSLDLILSLDQIGLTIKASTGNKCICLWHDGGMLLVNVGNLFNQQHVMETRSDTLLSVSSHAI